MPLNRREAIAALTSLPIASVARAQVAPESVIVIEADAPLPPEPRAAIAAKVRAVWPGQQVMVFDKGIRMRVVDR